MSDNSKFTLNPQPGPQTQFLKAQQKFVFMGGGAGGGKALRNDQRVLTPSGWVAIGDVKEGDLIVTPKNTIEHVTGVFPQGKVPLYKVVFADGREVVSCGEHLWYGGFGRYTPKGSLGTKTTSEIAAGTTSSRFFQVPTCDPIDKHLHTQELPIDPYVLGCLIGDGNMTHKHVCLSTNDPEMVDEIRSRGYKLEKWSSGKFEYGVYGTQDALRQLGLMGRDSHSKFIPDIYKNASADARFELVRGLIDTDGYVDKRSRIEYYSSNEQLCKDFQEVIWSLGGSAVVSYKPATCNGEKFDSYRVRVKFGDGSQLCRLSRKKERTCWKETDEYVAIREVIPVEPDLATCIAVSGPDKLFITENFIVTHNTWGILADNLKFVHDPNYFACFFRSTTTELETNLWPEAVKMYRPFLERQSGPNKGKWITGARIKDKDKTIIFPSGARCKFGYMMLDKDADAYYGAEISRIYMDEFHRFSQYQFDILRSRLRSKAAFPSAFRATMNPDPNHFVFDFVEMFLDEEGYPIRELSGRDAFFVVVNSQVYTAWSAEELIAKFPDKKPQTFTYIPSTLDDNKVLMELEPEYRDALDSMPEEKRKQLLLGCWFAQTNNAMYFKREWLHKAHSIPPDARCVRAWDKASEEPNPSLRHPDFTASVKMYKDRRGNYYLAGGCRFQKQSGPRDMEILRYAEHDGRDCHIVMPQDPGGAGADSFRQTTKMFLEEGFVVKKDKFPATKSKVSKFEPFATAAANGQVYLVESEWEPETLKIYLDELESFTGERSTASRKDDFVDATSSAFNTISREKVIPQFSLGDFSSSSPTSFKKHKDETGYYG